MIENSFHQALLFISNHPYWGIAFAFIISLAESLPIIGTIIPGSVTMTAIGTLIGANALPLTATLVWASIGAFCGDCMGYYLGKYCDTSIRSMWPFSKYPHWITKGEDYFHAHGGKSILIGRFVGPVRSTIPMIAGLLKLSTLRFMSAAIPSAICWALAYTVPGIILGALSLDLNPEVATKFVLIGLVVIVFGWLAFWASYRLGHYISCSIDKQFSRCWHALAMNQSRLYRLLKRQHYPNDHHQLTLFVFATIFAICFISVFLCVTQHCGLTQLNQPILTFMQSIRSNVLNHLFTVFTLLGDKPTEFGFAALMIIWLISQNHKRAACYVFMTSVLIAACIGFFKLIYHSPRPDTIQVVATSSSFPSGHTALAFVILGFCAYLGTLLASKVWRKVIYTTYICLVILVACSRLYLGAHWFSDIIGSITLGMTVLFSMILLYRRKLHGTRPTKPWLTAIALALCIPWITYGSWKFESTLNNYMPTFPKVNTSVQAWWKHPLANLPTYRDNRFGKPTLPFNVQWMASYNDLEKQLLQTGWKKARNPATLSYNIARLKSTRPNRHLPLVPILHNGKAPIATFYKPTNHRNEILELTLWQSSVRFINNEIPLWIGTLDYHRSVAFRLTQLSKQIHTLPPRNEIEHLILSLGRDNQYQLLQIQPADMPNIIRQLKWNGKIIVIRAKQG